MAAPIQFTVEHRITVTHQHSTAAAKCVSQVLFTPVLFLKHLRFLIRIKWENKKSSIIQTLHTLSVSSHSLLLTGYSKTNRTNKSISHAQIPAHGFGWACPLKLNLTFLKWFLQWLHSCIAIRTSFPLVIQRVLESSKGGGGHISRAMKWKNKQG